MRRILTLAGLEPVPGHPLRRPGPGDLVGVWGRSPLAPRGERVAAETGAALVRIEDAFLRSVRPGRMARGGGPLGLLIDRTGGVHFDAAAPSGLETILAGHPLDDSALLARARDGMARLAALRLSKYNLHDPALDAPPPGYVLVVDQTSGDAAIRHGGATWATFREMLFRALEDHPHNPVVIRTHPEVAAGLREGHFGPDDIAMDPARIRFLGDPVAPQALLEGAIAVYTVSSQLGFEAVLAGHRPVVFGRPFYAGWGLTDDQAPPVARRGRRLTRAQMFAASMILAPVWHDPCRDRLCSFEEAVDQLEAEVRQYREDRAGHVAVNMRLWKRGHLQAFFGAERPVRFLRDPAAARARATTEGRGLLVWGTADVGAANGDAGAGAGSGPEDGPQLRRVEDGFLRSRGLGADLVPPLSLVTDDLGIYYDPGAESRLERLIAAPLVAGGEARAARLIARLIASGVTKYNLGAGNPAMPTLPALPDRPGARRILVPGQVEDDASVRLGAGAERSNLALLERVRRENPDAIVIWKPHPDVEAGLRPGLVPAAEVARLADAVWSGVDAAAALAAVDEVWTITSGLGFEALLRGVPVVCLGVPFYAGWGLTRDLGPVPARRRARPSLAGLTHAALIAYPRYRDPISGLPCPAEVVVERLAQGRVLPRRLWLRLLAKAQGAASGLAPLWR